MKHPSQTLISPQTRASLRPRLHQADRGVGVSFIEGVLNLGLCLEQDGQLYDVDQAQLDAWGQTVEDLLPAAIDNLRRHTSVEELIHVDTTPGMYFYLAQNNLVAERLLLASELFANWPMGGLLACVPDNQQLLLVPLHAIAAVEILDVLVNSAQYLAGSSEDPLSNQVFWTDGGEWEHLHVCTTSGSIDLFPPENFLRAIERLAAMQLVPKVAEA
ncbi:MAG: hypothetical protein HN348_06620 [Proteobacteria bacterium]|nr:hypothetical protein [Pseudomonadota bacterium]